MLGWRSHKQQTALEQLRLLRGDKRPLKLAKHAPPPLTEPSSIYTLPIVLGLLAACAYALLRQSPLNGFGVGISLWGVFVVSGYLGRLSKLVISYQRRAVAQMSFFESVRSVLLFAIIFLSSASYLGNVIFEHLPKSWQKISVNGGLFLGWLSLGIVGQVLWNKVNFYQTLQWRIKTPKQRRSKGAYQPYYASCA